jgi:dTDP-4-amino-4,6-dideoxygalactose transaminase
VGINSRLDSIQAAVLSVKMSQLAASATGRAKNAQTYAKEFAWTGLDARIAIPTVKPGCVSVWNQFTVRVRDGERDNLQKHLNERKIGSAVYYPVPLHLQKCFAFLGHQAGSLPVTERACDEVLSLPIYECLTVEEQSYVIGSIAEYFGLAAGRRAA